MREERGSGDRKEAPRHITGPTDPTEAMIEGVAGLHPDWTSEKVEEYVKRVIRQTTKKETGESPQY